MTTAPPTPASNRNASTGHVPSAETKQIVLKEIRGKWSKFSEDDLSSLKNKDDLVAQRAAKYGLEKSVAQRDVEALMKGRQSEPQVSVSRPHLLRPRRSRERGPEPAMATFDYNAEAELFRRDFANRRTDDLVTDASPGRRTPFGSQSKSFRPNCFSAQFLKSTVRGMSAKTFAAFTIARIFPCSRKRRPR